VFPGNEINQLHWYLQPKTIKHNTTYTRSIREKQKKLPQLSEIKTGGLDQYGDEAFKQQQFGLVGVEGVKHQQP